ncbi:MULTISPECIES: hypothetical protein [unclassified Paenibacillus]|nr:MULTISPECIES: hypothetical protein [unclassified Paenibacillus]QID16062.1 hypothetical protein CIC07_25370 [Paenibacillus sp. RUD330]SIR02567.1 hypothetical protein SAMN05880555_2804 [Paenibacillus sp. RU4X]SIR32629.1 hypothetical protein SAMN05880570_3195 [Paenibacillus sp. RU4T]
MKIMNMISVAVRQKRILAAISRRLVVKGYAIEEVGNLELQKWKRRASP